MMKNKLRLKYLKRLVRVKGDIVDVIASDLVDYWREIDVWTQLITYTNHLPPCLYRAKNQAYSLRDIERTKAVHEYIRNFFEADKWESIRCVDVPQGLCKPNRHCEYLGVDEPKKPMFFKGGLGLVYDVLLEYARLKIQEGREYEIKTI
jgi:hypothetical protein